MILIRDYDEADRYQKGVARQKESFDEQEEATAETSFPLSPAWEEAAERMRLALDGDDDNDNM